MSASEELMHLDGSELAVVGMAGRFPGARNLDEFWRNLSNGVESVRFFTDEELRGAGVDPSALDKPSYVKARPVLDDVELFDAGFFGFNPTEAAVLDPQHRLFLECVWNAIENAGYDPEAFQGPISVFAGTSMSSYLMNNLYANPEAMANAGIFLSFLSNSIDSLATRIAYKLNLRGTCYTMQTFCSTSLVAVHVACQSLLNLECDMAVAGGVSIFLPQVAGYWFEEGGIRSPDGHCRPFDAKANGTLFGSGLGAVVLKRLEDALRDGDHIEAVIKGSASNNDGSLKASYSAPSVAGQAAVIVEALANANVEPDTISYVETHGTGTLLGDPAEIAALTQAYRVSTDKKGFCAIGSLKSNVGHLDAAAGIANFIKVVLSLKHQLLPPSLHFEKPNPEIDFPNSPFHVNRTLREWSRGGSTPRRAGVSAFGIGGTNAHVILQEAPQTVPSAPGRGQELLVLSAKTASALERTAGRLADFLRDTPEVNLADVAFTLQVGRRPFNHRFALVCGNATEAAELLAARDPHRLLSAHQERRNPPVVFMFPGDEASFRHAGADLYLSEPVFRKHVDAAAALFISRMGFDPREFLCAASTTTAQAAPAPTDARVASACLFTLEFALAELWQSWGIKPEALVGQGVGEFVAACRAGIFTLSDAVSLVSARAERLPSPTSQGLPPTGRPPQPLIGLHCKPPAVPLISSHTGTWMTQTEATNPDFWARPSGPPALFPKGIQELLLNPHRILVELGGGETLVSTVHALVPQAAERTVLASLSPAATASPQGLPMLVTLGRLWLAGANVDWAGVHGQTRRRRLALPSYPFERQRYWIDPQGPSPLGARNQRSMERKTNAAEWFWAPTWRRSDRPALAPEPAAPASVSSWLVFLDDCGLGEALVSRLRGHGHAVTTVTRGTQFAQHGAEAFTANVQVPDSFQTLVKQLRAAGRPPKRVVHVSSTSPRAAGDAAEVGSVVRSLAFADLLFLAQAMGEQMPGEPWTLHVVCNQLQEVIGGEILDPEKATALGPCRVIPQEYPDVRCSCIDQEWPVQGAAPTEAALESLVREVESQPADPVVAFRNGHRWVQTYHPVPLPAVPATTPKLRPRGTYLITGGLGGIGLALAEFLAETVQAKLVLLGRTSLPPSADWPQWLTTHGPTDVTSQRIRSVQSLERLGAEVMVRNADVANLEQMEAAVTAATERFGPVHGVIHAAGLAGGGIMQLRTVELASKVLAPKVLGTLVLERVFKDAPLDFLVLCSSTSSILGGVGQVDYCAANAFLDAFAQQHRTRNVLAINWCAWGEVGMAVNTEVPDDLKAEREASLRQGLRSQEGKEAFLRALHCGLPQVIVSTQDFSGVRELYATFRASSAKSRTSRATPGKQIHPRPVLSTPYAPPETPAEEAIVEIWQTLLGLEKVGRLDNFFELGGHSLLATQVLSRLRESFQVELSLRTLFEVTTAADLAKRVETVQWLAQGRTAAPNQGDREEIEL